VKIELICPEELYHLLPLSQVLTGCPILLLAAEKLFHFVIQLFVAFEIERGYNVRSDPSVLHRVNWYC
jgi:hypothetical protein